MSVQSYEYDSCSPFVSCVCFCLLLTCFIVENWFSNFHWSLEFLFFTFLRFISVVEECVLIDYISLIVLFDGDIWILTFSTCFKNEIMLQLVYTYSLISHNFFFQKEHDYST